MKCHAAIDEDGRSRHIVALVGGEPCRDLGRVLGVADAAIGNEGQQLLARRRLQAARLMRARMAPGAIELTRMRRDATSCARLVII